MKKSIKRIQLDGKLESIKRVFFNSSTINKQWIKTIRTALGMTSSQLAERLGVSQSRVSDIEKGELEGRLTIKTLKSVAQSMDCEFVYAIVPRNSLNQIVREQAEKVAQNRMKRVNVTMSLEDQSISRQQQRLMTEKLVNDLEDSNRIWDVKYK